MQSKQQNATWEYLAIGGLLAVHSAKTVIEKLEGEPLCCDFDITKMEPSSAPNTPPGVFDYLCLDCGLVVQVDGELPNQA